MTMNNPLRGDAFELPEGCNQARKGKERKGGREGRRGRNGMDAIKSESEEAEEGGDLSSFVLSLPL